MPKRSDIGGVDGFDEEIKEAVPAKKGRKKRDDWREDMAERQAIERKFLDQLAAEERHRDTVRADMNAAVEAILPNTKTGQNVKQDELHRRWWAAIDRAINNGFSIAVRSIPETGKTEQICHLWPIVRCGNDPFERIKIVGTDSKTANKHVVAIRSMVEDERIGQRVRRYWENVKPEPGGKWNDSTLFFERPVSGSKDASISSSGIFAAEMGARLRTIIFDDPFGAMSVVSEAYRDQVRQAFKTTWLSRLDTKGGFFVLLCNAWHEEDLFHTEIMAHMQTRCAVFDVALHEDMDRLKVYERYPVRVSPAKINVAEERYELPLPLGFTKADMERKREDLGEADFQRLYFMKAVSSKDMTFPNFGASIEPQTRIERWVKSHGESVTQNWESEEHAYREGLLRDSGRRFDYYGGVDVSGIGRPGSGIVTLAVEQSDYSIVIPVDIRFGEWDDDELSDQIGQAAALYGHKMILVETNALQERVKRTIQRKNLGVPIEGQYTGARKWDGQEGLPALDSEFKAKIWHWVFPFGHDKTCPCMWCRARREFTNHTRLTKNADIVMATWLAYEAYRRNAGNRRRVARAYTYRDLENVQLPTDDRAAIDGGNSAVDFDPFRINENGEFTDWHDADRIY